ncbi:MAG: hypothetical protein V3T17_02775 [Pseudomonadales bacterium]
MKRAFTTLLLLITTSLSIGDTPVIPDIVKPMVDELNVIIDSHYHYNAQCPMNWEITPETFADRLTNIRATPNYHIAMSLYHNDKTAMGESFVLEHPEHFQNEATFYDDKEVIWYLDDLKGVAGKPETYYLVTNSTDTGYRMGVGRPRLSDSEVTVCIFAYHLMHDHFEITPTTSGIMTSKPVMRLAIFSRPVTIPNGGKSQFRFSSGDDEFVGTITMNVKGK